MYDGVHSYAYRFWTSMGAVSQPLMQHTGEFATLLRHSKETCSTGCSLQKFPVSDT